MSEPVKVKLDNGSEVTGRWATLEEWMMPLAKDHPARKELFSLRMSLASAMAQIDKLERQNASLHQQFIEQEAENQQPKEKSERPDRKHDSGNYAPPKVLRGEAPLDAGNPVDEKAGPASPAQ